MADTNPDPNILTYSLTYNAPEVTEVFSKAVATGEK
jgi:hypothetical protein